MINDNGEWVIYDPTNGWIQSLHSGHVRGLEANTPVGMAALETVDYPNCNIDEHWVENGGLTRRAPMDLHLPNNVKTGSYYAITNVPVGTKVGWPDGEETIETDGNVEFQFDVSGDYIFFFDHGAHFREKVYINVSP